MSLLHFHWFYVNNIGVSSIDWPSNLCLCRVCKWFSAIVLIVYFNSPVWPNFQFLTPVFQTSPFSCHFAEWKFIMYSTRFHLEYISLPTSSGYFPVQDGQQSKYNGAVASPNFIAVVYVVASSMKKHRPHIWALNKRPFTFALSGWHPNILWEGQRKDIKIQAALNLSYCQLNSSEECQTRELIDFKELGNWKVWEIFRGGLSYRSICGGWSLFVKGARKC